MPQSEINALLVREGLAGNDVVRLKGGDPFIFGRGGEEAEACHAAGVPVEVVPGISSALGAAATFLDGIALAGILPAPLVIFATFVGYVTGALPGALAITAGMFLPAFAFSLLFYEQLEAIADHPSLQRALEGVAAAVAGIIGATFLQLVGEAWLRVSSPPPVLILFFVALVAAWRLKGGWVTPAILGAGAFFGAAVSL